MSKAATLAAAKERLREARAEAMNHAAKRAKRDADAAKAQRTLDRLAKTGPVIAYTEKDGTPPISTIGFAGFTLAGWGAPDTEAKIVDGLASGALKVSMPGAGSITVAPSTAVKRTRILSPLNAAAIKRAKAAEDKAHQRYLAAQKARIDLEAEAFAAGTKITPADLFPVIAKAHIAKKAIPFRMGYDSDKYEIERDERAIAQAELHLAAAKAGAECECDECKRARTKAAEDAATRQHNLDRFAAMAKRKVKCPDHGLTLMPWEWAERNLSSEKAAEYGFTTWGVHKLPLAYCTKGNNPGPYPLHLTILLRDTLDAERAKAAKAAAKSKPRQTKAEAKIAPLVGQTVAFTCPNCGADAHSEVYMGESDGGGPEVPYVGCEDCEGEFLAAGVAMTPERKAA